jgi:hypothetical protein
MPKTEDKLEKLCKGVRAIGAGVEIRIKPSEVISDHWSVMINAGAAIIAYTDFVPIEEALDQAIAKLATISTRMMRAIKETPPGTPSEPPGAPNSPRGSRAPSSPAPETPKKK